MLTLLRYAGKELPETEDIAAEELPPVTVETDDKVPHLSVKWSMHMQHQPSMNRSFAAAVMCS